MFSTRKLQIALALAVGLMMAGNACAVELQELGRETMQSRYADGKIVMAWWIPQEYWEASFAATPNMTPKVKADFMGVLQDYQLVAVLYVKSGIAGFTEISSEADILSNVHLESNGKAIDAVPIDKISPKAKAILAALKPEISGVLGQMGQNIHFIVYPGRNDAGRLLDPLRAGAFQISLYDQVFHWRLPLASLLPKKIDPQTHEEFPGNYDFNPYTGGKLSAK